MEIFQYALDLALGAHQYSKNYSSAVFALASSFYGIIIVMLDFCTSKVTDRDSLLKVTYRGFGTIRMLILWGFGSGLAGLVGSGFGIFEISQTACIAVGAGWPIILPRVLASSNQGLSKEKLPTE